MEFNKIAERKDDGTNSGKDLVEKRTDKEVSVDFDCNLPDDVFSTNGLNVRLTARTVKEGQGEDAHYKYEVILNEDELRRLVLLLFRNPNRTRELIRGDEALATLLAGLSQQCKSIFADPAN